MPKLIGLGDYATHRGVSRAAVQKACADGRIPFHMKSGRRMIDKDEADKAWKKNTNPTMGPSPYKKTHDHLQEMENVPSVAVQEAYIKAYKARLAKLEYEEKSGKVIDKKMVESQIITSHRIIRDAMRNIPQKIAPEIAAEVDPHKVEVLMLREIDSTLTELATLANRFK